MKKKIRLTVIIGMLTILFVGAGIAQKVWDGAEQIGNEYGEAMDRLFGNWEDKKEEMNKEDLHIEVPAEGEQESVDGTEQNFEDEKSEDGSYEETIPEDNNSRKSSAEVSDVSYYKEGFVEMERISKSLIGKAIIMPDWQEQLTEEEQEAMVYYEVDENGSGYMILSCFDGSNLSYYSNVFSTTNGGETWTKQSENGFDFDEICGAFSLNDHLIVYSRYGNQRAGYYNMFSVSHDRGQSFENVNPYIIADLERKFADMMITPVLLDMNLEQETMTLGWTSYADRDSGYFLIGEYDMNLNCLNEMERDEYFYAIYDWQEHHQFVFDDSDRRYLNAEEVEALKQACTLYSECNYNWLSFEEIIGYAINEIYYRRGYSFKDTPYEDYYSEYSWYDYSSPSYQKPESAQEDFNQFEQANVDLLAQYRAQAAMQ